MPTARVNIRTEAHQKFLLVWKKVSKCTAVKIVGFFLMLACWLLTVSCNDFLKVIVSFSPEYMPPSLCVLGGGGGAEQ